MAVSRTSQIYDDITINSDIDLNINTLEINEDAAAGTDEDTTLRLLAGDGTNLQKWQIINDSTAKTLIFQYAQDAGSYTTYLGLSQSRLGLNDDFYLGVGNNLASPDCIFGWNTTQTVDALYLGLSDAQNTFVIAEAGDIAFDFAHGAQTNPTLFIHSAAQSTTQWVSLSHNQTNAVIGTGAGGLDIVLAGNSDFTFTADVFAANSGSFFRLADNSTIGFGNTISAPDTSIGWNTTQTVDGWYFGTADTQNTIIIAENGDRSFDFAHAAQTNPTLFIHSASQSTTQWISFFHDQTNANVTSGAGSLNLLSAGATGIRADSASASISGIGASAGFFIFQPASDNTGIQIRSRTTTATTTSHQRINDSFGTSYSHSSGTPVFSEDVFTVNQSATAAYIAHRIAVTETSLGSGTSYLARYLAGAAGTTEKFSIRNTGDVAITQSAIAAGRVALTITPGAHTALTANVADISLADHTVTLADGTTIASASSVVLGQTTYNGVAAGGTETVTNAITLDVGPPIQGTNLTMTNAPVVAQLRGNVVVGAAATPAAGPTNTLFVTSGTAPTTTTNDTVAFYSSDNSAGNTIPSFYCEGTEVLATGQADSTSSVRVKMRINGTVVTLLAI